MSLLHTLAAHLRPPDWRPMHQIEREIVDELEFHLEMRTEDNLQTGMSPQAAREDARRRFGDFRRIHQTCRNIQLGERIMLQRIQVALTAVLLIVVVVMATGFYYQQAENEANVRQVRRSIEHVRKGLDGVLVLGCHPGDCHYSEGNYFTRRRGLLLKNLLEYVGIEPERFQVRWVSASEGAKFADTVAQVTKQIKDLGPRRPQTTTQLTEPGER